MPHLPYVAAIHSASAPHFHWARSGEYVTQVYGAGPLGLAYVDPADDPRTVKHGSGGRPSGRDD